MRKKILIIAAHPDDEILGCGGTVARLVSEGWCAETLILGEGITSRPGDGRAAAKLSALKKEAVSANRAIGVRKVHFADLPDNKFDSVPLLDVVKAVEAVKSEFRPDMVFTHYAKDLNIDHRVAFQAALTAFRPMPGETVREIYSFEVLSSTEWAFPTSFSPDVFWDISASIRSKLSAMRKYAGEIREYPHPRSLRGIELSAEYWGMRTGLKKAEAFSLVRALK